MRVVLKSPANQELNEAYEWYEAEHAGLGADFIKAFEHTLDAIR